MTRSIFFLAIAGLALVQLLAVWASFTRDERWFYFAMALILVFPVLWAFRLHDAGHSWLWVFPALGSTVALPLLAAPAMRLLARLKGASYDGGWLARADTIGENLIWVTPLAVTLLIGLLRR